MPSAETFTIKPIRSLVKWYLSKSKVSIDPFARNNRWATFTNDLNPETQAEFHLDAEVFTEHLIEKGIKADLVLFDPPYSTRQTKECYAGIGLDMPYERTIGWGELKNNIAKLLGPGGVCISFGWNSIGIGKERGFEIEKILLICHGRIHNDTICTVERKKIGQRDLFSRYTVVSAPGAVIKTERINLTDEEREKLTVDVRIPAYGES